MFPNEDESTYCVGFDGESSDLSRGGAYNSYLLLIVGVFSFSSLSWFALFLLVCMVIGVALDDTVRKPFNVSVMPRQLLAWSALTFRVVLDGRMFWLIALAAVSIFQPLVERWSGPYRVFPFSAHTVSGLHFYAVYSAIRALYLCFALYRGNNRKHLLWSYCIGNVGLAVRAWKYDVARKLVNCVLPHVSVAVPESWLWNGAYIVVAAMLVWFQVRFFYDDNVIFYKIHRTLHSHGVLYRFCHLVHHESHVPTVLDSGTISPAELMLTDCTMPVVLLFAPSAFCVGYEVLFLFGHLCGHASELDAVQFGRHHRLHHAHPNANFGIRSKYDCKWNTLHQQSNKN